jgi:hypothetical protein
MTAAQASQEAIRKRSVGGIKYMLNKYILRAQA